MHMTRHGASLHVQTPAKLNLALKVVGRREDGFHDLETLMVSVRLYDSLVFSLAHTDRITLSLASNDSSIPVDQSNLIVRAAQLLRDYSGDLEAGVEISLQKQIPSEAGMGGGSSDAAATLVGLNEFWGLSLPSSTLHELAAQLGSDVNFFLDSFPAAICTGRGEKITAVPLNSRLDFVIVKPATGLSTGDVFREWRESGTERVAPDDLKRFLTSINSGSRHGIGDHVFNSLTQPAMKLNSEIRHTLTQIENEDVVCSSMTGSGSACFGICRNQRAAQRIASRLRMRRVGQVWTTSTGV